MDTSFADLHPADADEDWGMATRDGNAALAFCLKRGAFQIARVPTRPVPVVSGWVIHMTWTFSGEMPGDEARALIREFLTAESERRNAIAVNS